MKTIKLTVVEKDNYESPEVRVTEIQNESVLCVSSLSNEGWQEDTPDW